MGSGGSKREKNGPNWEKRLLRSISQELYIIWFSFMVLHLWYSCVKWQYIQQFFSFFQILIFGVVKRVKNSPKWKKLSLSWYLRNNTSYRHLWCTSVKWYYQAFVFFKILIFGVVRRDKGQKMAQNDKKLCPLYFISQEPYMIWSWFMAHMCKRIVSAGNFCGQYCGKRAKIGPKWQKTGSVALWALSKHMSFDCVFCCTSLKRWHLLVLFSFFQNSDFFGFSKFINAKRKFARYAPPSSHVCDFISFHPPFPLSLCTSYWWYLLKLFLPCLASF